MNEKISFRERFTHLAPVIGSILVLSGLLLFVDQRLQTNWLSISIPVSIGLLVFIWSAVRRQLSGLIIGLLMFAGGGALFFGLQKIFPLATGVRLVYIFSIMGISILLVFFLLVIFKFRSWWILFPAGILLGLAYQFAFQKLTLLDFTLVHCMAICIVFLFWGSFNKKIGLVIPGALLGTMGIGAYAAWFDLKKTEVLQSTGIMLVWFSLGWILVTIFYRIIKKRFSWWPLIPGGVMLMVGAGLYLGGNPENALGFFGNTGSIALILLGIYLILMKFGLNQRNR